MSPPPTAGSITLPTLHVRFRPDPVSRVHPIGMSIQDIANRAQPNMKLLHLVLVQVQRQCTIEPMTARRALLSVLNLNEEAPFLARRDAERIEQFVPDPVEPGLMPGDERYSFLHHVLPPACATFDPLRELGLIKAVHTALAGNRRLSSADAGDALLGILALNERSGFLSEEEAGRVEISLKNACNRSPRTEDDDDFLYDMAVLTLEFQGLFSQPPAADASE